MATRTARNLRRGGRAVLSGFHPAQARMVLAAHRRAGMVLERQIVVNGWATLVLRRP